MEISSLSIKESIVTNLLRGLDVGCASARDFVHTCLLSSDPDLLHRELNCHPFLCEPIPLTPSILETGVTEASLPALSTAAGLTELTVPESGEFFSIQDMNAESFETSINLLFKVVFRTRWAILTFVDII